MNDPISGLARPGHSALPWLRLVRWPNLLIIALTQFVAWWGVIHAIPGPKTLTSTAFLLLCSSTVLIAAGGYIINDYFDVRIDVINKPDKVILERDIPRKLAIIMHSVVNVLAIILAGLIAVPAGHPEWLLLQLLCTLLLWRYSTTWKRQFIIGNVVVALMTALTVVAVMIYEPLIWKMYREPALLHISKFYWRINPFYLLACFGGFAFILTWMREIVKDMEDYKGDDMEGCITMPIRLGLLKSTRFVQALAAIAVLSLAYASYRIWRIDFHDLDVVLYILAILVPSIIVWALRLPFKASPSHYHKASQQLKLIMVLGIITLIVYHF